jgi:hypothetical protein
MALWNKHLQVVRAIKISRSIDEDFPFQTLLYQVYKIVKLDVDYISVVFNF